MVSNTAWGEMTVSGPTTNVLSFFLDGVDKPVMMNYLPHTGTYTIAYRETPVIKKTDRCTIPMAIITVHTDDPCTTFLTSTAFAECDLECAWDIDSGGLLEASKKYQIHISASVEEENEGFRHVFEVYSGRVESDYTEDLPEEY